MALLENPVQQHWHFGRNGASAGFVEEFLATRSAATASCYRRDLEDAADFVERSGSELATARRAELARYVRSLERDGRSPATIRRRLAALSGFYRYLVAEGLRDRSPLVGLRRPAGGGEVRIGLDAASLRRLVEAAHEDGERSELLVALLLYVGLRVSEAVGVDAAHVRLYERSTVVVVRRKGGREEVLGVPAPVAELLDAAIGRQGPGPVLRGARGGRLSRQVAWRDLCHLVAVAGIDEHVFPHLLRHSYVSQALLAGVALPVVAAGAGHRDVRSTITYAAALASLGAEAGTAVIARVAAAGDGS